MPPPKRLAPPTPRVAPSYGSLSAIKDPKLKLLLKTLMDRVSSQDEELQLLRQYSLQAGSAVDALGQRVENAADPRQPRDLVTLAYLRQYVQNQVLTAVRGTTNTPQETGTPGGTPGPTPGPGPGPTNPPAPPPAPGPGNPLLPLPDFSAIVDAYAASHPTQLENSCVAQGGNNDFLIGVARAIFAVDQRIGFDWKRGAVGDLSQDCLAYYWGPGIAYEGASQCYVVDVIGGHCAPGATPNWQDVGGPPGWTGNGILVPVVGGPQPEPPSGTQGRLKQVGPGFTFDGAPYDIYGITAFTLFFNYAYGGQGSFVSQQISAMQANGIKCPRILVTVNRTGGWYEGQLVGYPVRLDPSEHTDFYVKLNAFASLMQQANLCPEYVVFGDCFDGFETRAIRDAVCRNVGAVLRAYPCLVEISNEPESTALGREGSNLNAYDPWVEANRLCTVYKTADTNNPVANAGGYTAGQLDRAPADWLGYQNARSTGNDKWDWIVGQITASPVQVNGNPRATVNDEPMCASGNPDNNQNDTNPVHWWAFGALAQLLKIGVVFHSQELLGALVTSPAIQAQLQAWRQGSQLVSSQMTGSAFYATSAGGPVGSSPWTATTALALYGRQDGLTGLAIVMKTPGGWSPSTSLAAGWTAVIVEQRQDAVLVRLTKA